MSQAASSGRVSPLRLLQATTLVSTLDRFAMPPMLVAIATSLGVPLTQVVTAAGAYFLVYGLGQPLWGFASDRYGRVRTLRTSLVVAGVFSLVSALSPTVLVLGAMFVGKAFALMRDPAPERAIKFFVFSNVYLMLVFVAVAVDALLA